MFKKLGTKAGGCLFVYLWSVSATVYAGLIHAGMPFGREGQFPFPSFPILAPQILLPAILFSTIWCRSKRCDFWFLMSMGLFSAMTTYALLMVPYFLAISMT